MGLYIILYPPISDYMTTGWIFVLAQLEPANTTPGGGLCYVSLYGVIYDHLT